MNSTDRANLATFYHQHLVEAADRLRERGVSFYAEGFDDAESWYVDFGADEPDLMEFGSEDHARLLREMWEKQGLPELAALAERLVQLGESLEVQVEQTAEVSPTIYVMH